MLMAFLFQQEGTVRDDLWGRTFPINGSRPEDYPRRYASSRVHCIGWFGYPIIWSSSLRPLAQFPAVSSVAHSLGTADRPALVANRHGNDLKAEQASDIENDITGAFNEFHGADGRRGQPLSRVALSVYRFGQPEGMAVIAATHGDASIPEDSPQTLDGDVLCPAERKTP
jgi:hypothetical protein